MKRLFLLLSFCFSTIAALAQNECASAVPGGTQFRVVQAAIASNGVSHQIVCQAAGTGKLYFTNWAVISAASSTFAPKNSPTFTGTVTLPDGTTIPNTGTWTFGTNGWTGIYPAAKSAFIESSSGQGGQLQLLGDTNAFANHFLAQLFGFNTANTAGAAVAILDSFSCNGKTFSNGGVEISDFNGNNVICFGTVGTTPTIAFPDLLTWDNLGSHGVFANDTLVRTPALSSPNLTTLAISFGNSVSGGKEGQIIATPLSFTDSQSNVFALGGVHGVRPTTNNPSIGPDTFFIDPSNADWYMYHNLNLVANLKSATMSTATNCSAVGSGANPSVAACGSASAGSFSCATAASTGTCQVNTTAVTAASEIFITSRADTTTGTRLGVTCNTGIPTVFPVITAVSAGASFTINLGTVAVNPECWSYRIVN